MHILAHRGNINGPNRDTENTYPAFARALALGFGLEIDLRRSADGTFYLNHDPITDVSGRELSCFAELFERYRQNVIAVNVKELGYEADLIRLQKTGAFGAVSFYFDFELLQPQSPGAAQSKIRALPGGQSVRLAARISDRGESVDRCMAVPAQVVWADEFDKFWITADHLRRMKDAGRSVYVISPELHGFSRQEQIARWREIGDWGIDGICTDYALEADLFFNWSQHARLSA